MEEAVGPDFFALPSISCNLTKNSRSDGGHRTQKRFLALFWWQVLRNRNRIMKQLLRYSIPFFVFVLAAFAAPEARAQQDVTKQVSTSLKAGSSRELARFFNKSVELIIDGEKSSYSKIQAELVLKDFLKKYPPSDFEFVHQGASKEGLHYAIGKYKSADHSFRVYMLLKRFEGEYLIDTLDFSKE